MKIFILRHGKAEEIGYNVRSDAKRKLTSAGRRNMIQIVNGIKNIESSFDYILSSPLLRAKQTADIVTNSIYKKDVNVTLWDELKPEADITDTHRLLVNLPPDAKILVVGHLPHLTDLIISIITHSVSNKPNITITDNNMIDISLKKGGLAIIDANPHHSKITGSLSSLLTPKQLKLCR